MARLLSGAKNETSLPVVEYHRLSSTDHEPIENPLSTFKPRREIYLNKFPVPTKPERGLYSRLMYDADLVTVDWIESLITHRLSVHEISGCSAKLLYADCTEMRKLCKAALFRTRILMAAKEAERTKPPEDEIHIQNVRLSTHQQETLRRIATDKKFAEEYFKKENSNGRSRGNKET